MGDSGSVSATAANGTGSQAVSDSTASAATIVNISGQEQTLPVSVVASYDMGWAKRRQAMNSASGVGAMIGLHSGKVLAYDSRKKKCRICEEAQKKGVHPSEHDC